MFIHALLKLLNKIKINKNSSVWDVKEPTHYSRSVGDVVPGVAAVLCAYMGGWVKHVYIS